MERSCYSSVLHYGSWLSLLFAFLTDKASVQGVTVEAVVGDSVVLQCSAGGYQEDVYWRDEGSRTVYDVIGGKGDFHDQHAMYKGRVEAFLSEFSKGNYSIRLSDMKPTDTGRYSCRIPYSGTHYVEVKVKSNTQRVSKKEHSARFSHHKFVQTSGGVKGQSHNHLCFSAALIALLRNITP